MDEMEGRFVGSRVGSIEGIPVGELEASLVGSCDGSGVELPVGVKVEGDYELD